MAIRKQILLKEYRERLDAHQRELTRWPRDSVEATRLRDLIAHYERQIRDIERPSKRKPSQIGAGPTLGGDGKPVIDC